MLEVGVRFMAVAACLLLAACSSAPVTSGESYQTYAYNCCAEISEITVWHPGEHLTLHWQSQANGTTTVSTPQTVKLRLTLTGPFSTVDALKTAITSHRIPTGVRSIDAETPAVSDRTGGTPASELNLPADLAPGYYNLEQSESIGANSVSGGVVVAVQ